MTPHQSETRYTLTCTYSSAEPGSGWASTGGRTLTPNEVDNLAAVTSQYPACVVLKFENFGEASCTCSHTEHMQPGMVTALRMAVGVANNMITNHNSQFGTDLKKIS
eukprot:UN3062